MSGTYSISTNLTNPMNKVYPHTEIPTVFDDKAKTSSVDVVTNDLDDNMYIGWYDFTDGKWLDNSGRDMETPFTWMYKPEEFGEGVG